MKATQERPAMISEGTTTNIWVTRHAERTDDPGFRKREGLTRTRDGIPNVDIPITDKGRTITRVVGGYLRDKKIDYIYSSPALRCVQTASIIATELGLSKIRLHDGLSETMLLLQAPPLYKMDDQWQQQYPLVDLSTFTPVADFDEDVDDSYERFRATAMDLVRRHPGSSVLIVTHADAFRALAQLPEKEIFIRSATYNSLMKMTHVVKHLLNDGGDDDKNGGGGGGGRVTTTTTTSSTVTTKKNTTGAIPPTARPSSSSLSQSISLAHHTQTHNIHPTHPNPNPNPNIKSNHQQLSTIDPSSPPSVSSSLSASAAQRTNNSGIELTHPNPNLYSNIASSSSGGSSSNSSSSTVTMTAAAIVASQMEDKEEEKEKEKGKEKDVMKGRTTTLSTKQSSSLSQAKGSVVQGAGGVMMMHFDAIPGIWTLVTLKPPPPVPVKIIENCLLLCCIRCLQYMVTAVEDMEKEEENNDDDDDDDDDDEGDSEEDSSGKSHPSDSDSQKQERKRKAKQAKRAERRKKKKEEKEKEKEKENEDDENSSRLDSSHIINSKLNDNNHHLPRSSPFLTPQDSQENNKNAHTLTHNAITNKSNKNVIGNGNGNGNGGEETEEEKRRRRTQRRRRRLPHGRGPPRRSGESFENDPSSDSDEGDGPSPKQSMSPRSPHSHRSPRHSRPTSAKASFERSPTNQVSGRSPHEKERSPKATVSGNGSPHAGHHAGHRAHGHKHGKGHSHGHGHEKDESGQNSHPNSPKNFRNWERDKPLSLPNSSTNQEPKAALDGKVIRSSQYLEE